MNRVAHLVEGIPYEMSAEQTEGKEGYVQPYAFKVVEGKLVLRTLLRDFETAGLAAEKTLVQALAPYMEIKDEYLNMAEVLRESPRALQIVREAMITAGVPDIQETETRGGTEAAVYTLSIETMSGKPEPGRRIPTVNFGGLGEGFHTVREYQAKRALVDTVATLININRLVVEGKYAP